MDSLGPLAKALRGRMTDAERWLWNRLRNRKLAGYKFRRQVAIGSYIVDFICMDSMLIVELDGGHHAAQRAEDQGRTEVLERLGYRVIRFSNRDVLSEGDAVLRTILGALAAKTANARSTNS